MKNKLLFLILVLTYVFLPKTHFGQAPTLGTAADFVLFTSVGAVGNSGISHVTGNVGSNSGSSTGFGNVNGGMHDGDPASAQCAVDVLSAYGDISGVVPAFFPAPLLGNGQILVPGNYEIPAPATMNLDLTLDAQGDPNAVFIIRILGSFSTGAGSSVELVNGALACNVYWQVEGLVSMAAGTSMKGTIIVNNAAINLSSGSTLEGRALSTNGAITIDGVLAYTPIGCGSPVLTGPGSPTLGTTACYALFSSDGPVTNAGVTFVTGDVGTNLGLTTGYNPLNVTGTIHPIPDGSTLACANDLAILYTYLNTLPTDIELLYPAQFGNSLVLTPHTYLMNAAVTFTDTVFLNGLNNPDAVFVINVNGAFGTSTFSVVKLINGTQAKNVYWNIDGAVDLNDNSTFVGTIIANNGAMTLNTGLLMNGRALTTTGALLTNAITITIPSVTAGAGSISGASSVCANQLGVPYSVANIDNASNYVWTLPAGATIASGLNTNSITVDFGNNGGIITVQGNNPCGNGTVSADFPVSIDPLPDAAGNITGASPVCDGALGVAYSVPLIANATGYSWNLPVGAVISSGINTNSITVDFGSAGGNITVQGTNACGNGAISSDFPVAITPFPADAGIITGSANVCENDLGVAYSVPLISDATNYVWSLPLGASISSGINTNSITVDFGSNGGVITVQGNNGCGNGLVSPDFTVTMSPLAGDAGIITGTSPVCAGALGIAFSVPLIANATTYIWTLPLGATIATGLNTNSITVDFGNTGGTITVQGSNACGSGLVSPDFIVVVNPMPADAGIITGSANVCEGAIGVSYSVSAILDATDYIWVLPAGASFNTGANTNSITVDFGNTGGIITVQGNNACGAGLVSPDFIVTVNPLPAAAGIITGTAVVCAGDLGVAYSVPLIANATDYTWILPLGATIASGANTNSITVDFGNTGGVITVQGSNACGNGVISPDFIVSVNAIPVASASSNSPVCAGDLIQLNAATVASASYAWTGPNAFASASQNPTIAISTLADAGIYSLILTLNGCASAASTTTVVVSLCVLDLAVVKTVDNMSPKMGDDVVFTITATNNGPIAATGVQVNDMLPAGYSFVSSTVSTGSYSAASGVWTIGNLASGVSASLTITATVNAAGSYVNTAVISGIETDVNMANNTSSVTPVPTDFFIPEGFSPNGDGVNDLFVIRGIASYPNNHFTVFNRWGNPVFDGDSYMSTWDGTATEGLQVGGDELPTGTYFYILDLGDGTDVIKGSIYLIR